MTQVVSVAAKLAARASVSVQRRNHLFPVLKVLLAAVVAAATVLSPKNSSPMQSLLGRDLSDGLEESCLVKVHMAR